MMMLKMLMLVSIDTDDNDYDNHDDDDKDNNDDNNLSEGGTLSLPPYRPAESSKHHSSPDHKQNSASKKRKFFWSSLSKLDRLCHLVTWLPEAILSPEEGQDELLGELADHRDVRVPPEDRVQLELWPECEGEAELWVDVGEHLVLLLLRLHTDHCLPERRVSLIEMWIGKSDGSASWQRLSGLARAHVHHSRLEARETFVVHAIAFVLLIPQLRVFTFHPVAAQGIFGRNEPLGNEPLILS